MTGAVDPTIVDAPRVGSQEASSRLLLVGRRFLRQRLAVGGLLVVLLLFALAYLTPYISPWQYNQLDTSAFLTPPAGSHWFGTTQNGFDMFALTMRGMQKSLIIGLLGALIATALAAVVGAFAGYFGGILNTLLMTLIDLLLVLPAFLIIAILSPTFRGRTWLFFVVLLAAFQWMITARIVRGMTLSLKEREFVQAARFMGVPGWQIIFRHILPNMASLLIIDATVNVSSLILAEVGLSFFGFGVQPPDVSLGTLIGDYAGAALTYPWEFYFPAGFLVVLVLAINLVGDGLRDAFDPNARVRGRIMSLPGNAVPAIPLLAVTDLSVTFSSDAGPVTAVRSLTYQIQPGEVVGIVGESGSGKTVSSLAVMDLLPAHARITGSVRFRGEELTGRSDKDLSDIRGRKIAMIFQDPLSALTPVYTVGDQIAEAILVHEDVGREAAQTKAIDLLALVGIPNPRERAGAFPHEFSGGMRQRVMIAMAIANDPDLIIADEPTTALDVTIQAQILELLQTARRVTGAAILLITHDLGVVAGFADRVAVMYAGKLVETGAVDDVFYRPRMPYTLGLLGSIPRADIGHGQPLTPIEGTPPSLVSLPAGCPFVPRCPMRIEKCVEIEPRLASMTASGDGHCSACHRSDEIERLNMTSTDVFPAPIVPPAAIALVPRERRTNVLEVRDLVKEYSLTKGAIFRRRVGTVHAVDGISFDIREGETLGLVGESGCGKTTTIVEILNMIRPSSGSIVVLGKDTASMTAGERFTIRRDVQVVFQDPMASLDPRLPIGDILAEPLKTHRVPAADRASRVRELLQLVGLQPEHVNRYPQAFSGGQRQRIGIARALALQPKVLVLDEPVSALDVSVRAGIINLLERLKAELGLSYLFVAHDLAVVRHIADRVAVMYLGRIVEIGEVDEVFDRPAHPYTQALLSAIPLPDPRKERQRRRIVLQGDLPSPANPPSGCRFRTRCQKFAHELDDSARQRCITESPALLARTGGSDHLDACHYATPSPVL